MYLLYSADDSVLKAIDDSSRRTKVPRYLGPMSNSASESTFPFTVAPRSLPCQGGQNRGSTPSGGEFKLAFMGSKVYS